MGKASWIDVTPSSGSGDGSVAVSSVSEYTGRVARESDITFKAANCDDVIRTVIQAGKPEYVEFDSSTAVISKDGGKATLTGMSNSTKLTFSLGSGELEIELPNTYIANSLETVNGAEITGDPGTDAAYPFSITFDVPESASVNELSKQVIVTDAVGNTSMCTLTEAASDAYLIVEEGDIYLDYLGTAVDVAVESNTNWTVE